MSGRGSSLCRIAQAVQPTLRKFSKISDYLNKDEIALVSSILVGCENKEYTDSAANWPIDGGEFAIHRPVNRKSGEKPIPPPGGLNVEFPNALDMTCKAVVLHEIVIKEKLPQAWVCDQAREWRRYGMLPRAPDRKPTTPVAKTPPVPTDDDDPWLLPKLSETERGRNFDFLVSTCRAANTIKPSIIQTVQKYDVMSPLELTKYGAFLKLCNEDGKVNLGKDWPEDGGAFAIHRPANRQTGTKPMPPTVNNEEFAFIFDIVCNGVSYHQSLTKNRIPQGWACDQVREWRQYNMFVASPVKPYKPQ